MTEEIKIGSVVKCEEHDSLMCIHEIRENTYVCDWFIEADLQRVEFEKNRIKFVRN